MAANGTPQAMLRQLQGGSPTSRGQNERAQRATRNTSPNTVYNQGSNNMYSMMNPFMGGYSPYGMFPSGGQYGNQQSNLARYSPPGYGGSDRGGYAYNIPNAYGSTGLGYMSGFEQMGIPFNPFIGYQNPQNNFGNGYQTGPSGYAGGRGSSSFDDFRSQMGQQGNGNSDFMAFLQQMFGGRGQGQPDVSDLQNRMPVERANPGYRPYKGGGFGPMRGDFIPRRSNVDPSGMQITPGMNNTSGSSSPWPNPQGQTNIPMTSTPSGGSMQQVPGATFGAGLPWGLGGSPPPYQQDNPIFQTMAYTPGTTGGE